MILTRSPLNPPPKKKTGPFDLHVLSTPPAFVLSQDQTLQTKPQPKSRSQTYGEQTPTHTQPPTKGGQAGNTQPPSSPTTNIEEKTGQAKNTQPQQKSQATHPTPSTTKLMTEKKARHKTAGNQKTSSHPPTMNTKHDTLSRSQTTHPPGLHAPRLRTASSRKRLRDSGRSPARIRIRAGAGGNRPHDFPVLSPRRVIGSLRSRSGRREHYAPTGRRSNREAVSPRTMRTRRLPRPVRGGFPTRRQGRLPVRAGAPRPGCAGPCGPGPRHRRATAPGRSGRPRRAP